MSAEHATEARLPSGNQNGSGDEPTVLIDDGPTIIVTSESPERYAADGAAKIPGNGTAANGTAVSNGTD